MYVIYPHLCWVFDNKSAKFWRHLIGLLMTSNNITIHVLKQAIKFEICQWKAFAPWRDRLHWRCSSTTWWPKGFLVFRLWRSRRILRQKLLHRFLLLQLHTLLQKKTFSSSTVFAWLATESKERSCGTWMYVVCRC